MSIQQKIDQGYQSLAARAQQKYEQTKDYLMTRAKASQGTLALFLEQIDRIAESGNPYHQEFQGGAFQFARDNLEHAIHPLSKPTSEREALWASAGALATYTGAKSTLAFLASHQFDDYEFSPRASLIYRPVERGNSRIFQVMFNNHRPAYSLLANLSTLYKEQLPEEKQVRETIETHREIEGFTRLERAIKKVGLKAARAKAASETHILDFFSSSSVLSAAKLYDVPMEEFISFYQENLARFDFQSCYAIGDALLAQERLAADAITPQDEEETNVLELLAFASILFSPFAKHKGKLSYLGIGLAEYLNNNPEEREKARSSKTFQHAFSEEFFERSHLRST